MSKLSTQKQVRWTRTLALALGLVFGTLACGPAVMQSGQNFNVDNRVASVEQKTERAVVRTASAVQDQVAERVDVTAADDELELKPGMKLRRVRNHELNRGLQKKARQIINANFMKPYGTDVLFEMDGKLYSGRIEKHYHEPGGKARPWGWHPGCSLFVAEAAS